MDRIFSARIDESVVNQIGILARELNTTKKNIIEKAISLFSEQASKESSVDIFDFTCGAWKREETVAESVHNAKQAFRKSMTRHHQ